MATTVTVDDLSVCQRQRVGQQHYMEHYESSDFTWFYRFTGLYKVFGDDAEIWLTFESYLPTFGCMVNLTTGVTLCSWPECRGSFYVNAQEIARHILSEKDPVRIITDDELARIIDTPRIQRERLIKF